MSIGICPLYPESSDSGCAQLPVKLPVAEFHVPTPEAKARWVIFRWLQTLPNFLCNSLKLKYKRCSVPRRQEPNCAKVNIFRDQDFETIPQSISLHFGGSFLVAPTKSGTKRRDFDPEKFLATIGEGRKVVAFPKFCEPWDTPQA